MEKTKQYKLKEFAHNTIAAELNLEELKDWTFDDPEFNEKHGVFVTLEVDGQLRGCIGNIDPMYTLWEGVKNNAYAAAFGDPRFDPLTREEFENIDIEISVLTHPHKSTVNKITPGVDGVVLRLGAYSATYLPQVWEDIPDKEKFLSGLLLKAGLEEKDLHDQNLEVFTYQVEKF